MVLTSLLSAKVFAQQISDIELSDISFEGNESFSDVELKRIITATESPSWYSKFFDSFTPWGEEAVYFDSLSLPTDISLLNSFYRVNGFFECEVDYKYNIDREDKSVDLTFVINEGAPYHFRRYQRTGMENALQHFVEPATSEYTADTTMRYSENFVQSDISYITNYMRDRGYMFFNFDRPEVIVDTVQNKVDVTVNFIPGNYYKINKINVVKDGAGSDLVDDELIKDITGIKKGDTFSEDELSLAQVRLYRTNLFSSAQVDPVREDTVKNQVPLVVNTTIGLMNEFIPELILNDEDGVINVGFSLGFSRKNFLGDARRLTLQTSIAAQDIFWFISNPSLSTTDIYGYLDTRLILEQPFLFGKLITTKFEVYNTLQKRTQNYNQYIFGSGLSFDFTLPPQVYFTSFVAYFNWEHEKTRLFDDYLKGIYEAYIRNNRPDIKDEDAIKDTAGDWANNTSDEQRNSSTNNTVIGVNLSANQTNSLLFPTRGYRINLILENGNAFPYLFSKIASTEFENPLYYKVVLNTSYFFPYYESIKNALGTKFVLGNIHTYEGNYFDIPINQRFTAGGSNSVRGWGSRELVPTGSEIPVDIEGRPIEELNALFFRNTLPGGFFWFEGSFETRNRIWQDMGGALFVDYGNVWNGPKDFRWDRVAVAAGFGLRYYTSFAPFRIDVGFKIYDPADPRPMSHKQIWDEVLTIHFGVGEAF